jgi:hypothetical protein
MKNKTTSRPKGAGQFGCALPSRRAVLKGLGVAGAVAPLLPALDGWAASGAERRKRLLLVFSSNGMVPDHFWPVGGERDFSFGPGSSLEPLTPHKGDLIEQRGLGRKLQGVGGGHERAMGGLWTGARLNAGSQFGGGGWPSGPSVDQIIARALPRSTDFASLEVGVQPFGPGAKGGTMQHMCYAGSDQPIPSEGSPFKLFDRLFGSDPLGKAGALEQIRAERRSVMDLMRRELGEAQRQVGAGDRLKIEAHLEAVRAIERRLESASTPRTCEIRTPAGLIDVHANENFPALVKLQTDLLISAFTCDRTRVASLQLSRSFSMVRHTWLGSNEGHHTLSHDQNEWPVLAAINRWYAEQLAYLLAEMKKVPDGEGSLLDNTLVVYCNELHTGWDHKAGPEPTILAGRLGGAVRTGRYVDYGKDSPHQHEHLLVTLCHAMGLTGIKQVGNLGTEGALPGILG